MAHSHIQLQTSQEISLTASGLSLLALSQTTNSRLVVLSKEEIEHLSRPNYWKVDQASWNQWNPQAADWSDYGAMVLGLSPMLPVMDGVYRQDFMKWGLVWAETNMLNIGMNWLIKNWTHRTRPYVYNENVPLRFKLQPDAQRSFYSLHTAFAFSNGVLFASYMDKVQPQHSAAVWAGTITLASTVGYLRYKSGQHYVSDIVVGAIIGSFWGWLLPELHWQNKETSSPQTAKMPPILFSIQF